jgi:hypothetical protein
VSSVGLDAEKLRLLEQWAQGLQRDERPEIAASGRAISMLIEEVERLHVELWDRRLYPAGEALDGDALAHVSSADDDGGKPELEPSLRRRLRSRWAGSPHR